MSNRTGQSGRPITALWRWSGALAVTLGVLGLAVFLLKEPSPEAQSLPEVAQEELELTELGLCLKKVPVPFNGWMVTRYPDGGLRSRSHIVNGQMSGISEGWYPDGTPEVREYFINGVSHGLRTRWHPNGRKASETEIVDGQVHGTFRRWHENGQLSQVIHMNSGEPHGISEAWFPSGSLQARVELNLGKVVSQEFWDDGEVPTN